MVVAGHRGHALYGPCFGGVLGNVAEMISRLRLLIASKMGPFCRKVVYGNYKEGLMSIHYFYGHKITQMESNRREKKRKKAAKGISTADNQ